MPSVNTGLPSQLAGSHFMATKYKAQREKGPVRLCCELQLPSPWRLHLPVAQNFPLAHSQDPRTRKVSCCAPSLCLAPLLGSQSFRQASYHTHPNSDRITSYPELGQQPSTTAFCLSQLCSESLLHMVMYPGKWLTS